MTEININQDYQVVSELKAQNSVDNLIQIDLSLEAKTFLAYKYKITNRDKLLKKLKRANPNTTKQIFKKSKFICKQAVELAETILKKIFSGKRVLLNHKYISKITECDSTDQNKRILDQLDNFFMIKYHRLAIVDGVPYNYHYSFELHPAIIEELKDSGLWNLEFMPVEMRLSYNNRPYIFSKNIYRSNKSKFFENSNFNNTQAENIETTEIKKPITKSADIKVLVSKKKFLANKRKKVTNSEQITRYQKFKAYDKPKNLSQHYPLSQEDCYELQKRSSKAYNLNAMNEILLDMSRKPEIQGHSFVSKAKFMCYMTKAYREEGRDVNKANQAGFKIIKRRPKAEIEEIVTLNQREKYLNQVENAAIHARCDYTQFRAKIAGIFPINKGYDLLKAMISVKKKDSVFEIIMNKSVELTEHYKQLLIIQANAVGGYAGVDKLEFC
ncbi:MAG: hypothetical protein AB8B66_02280 [Rickettsiaceae bacterium]